MGYYEVIVIYYFVKYFIVVGFYYCKKIFFCYIWSVGLLLVFGFINFKFFIVGVFLNFSEVWVNLNVIFLKYSLVFNVREIR